MRSLIPAFLRRTAADRMTDRLLFGRNARSARWAPVAAVARRDPFADVVLDDGLPAAEWMDASDVAVAPLDARAATRVLEASLGAPWTGPAEAPPHVRVALAVLAEAGGHGVAGRAMAAVRALVGGDRADAGRLADAVLSPPAAAAFVREAAQGHAFTGGVLCAALLRALPRHGVGLSDLAFLKALDRPAWFAMLSLARGPSHPEGWALLEHHADEVSGGEPLKVPRVARTLGRVATECRMA